MLTKSNEAKLTALARAHFSPSLNPAERRIIHDSVRQGPAKTHPNIPAAARVVRGEFLRWILSDAAVMQYFDKDGLQVVSAIIDGDVDIDSINILHDVRFDGCIFTKGIHFLDAAARNITIANSTVNGNLGFDNATIRGDVVLYPEFTVYGYISLYEAQISGDLNMPGAKLKCRKNDKKEFSLTLDEADIKGIVYATGLECEGAASSISAKLGILLADAATFMSTLNMSGTIIKEDLILTGAKFLLQKTSGSAISIAGSAGVNLDRMSVGGSVYLSGANLDCRPISLSMQDAIIRGSVYITDKLRASGKLDMSGIRIRQALYVMEVTLAELDADHAQIGEFAWIGILNAPEASLNLTRSRVGILRDNQNSWPMPGHLAIIGLVYDDINLEVAMDRPNASAPLKIGGNDPTDRIMWLYLQSKGDQVASQPWAQLAQYVSGSGNPAGARKVLYEMKRIQAWNAGAITGWRTFVPDYLDENPWRVTYFTGAFWGIGSLVFWRARRMNAKAMAPKEKAAYDEFCVKGTLPPHVPPFNPVVYALENVLPVVKFGQDDAWGPNPSIEPGQRDRAKRQLPRALYTGLALTRLLLIILGWALAIILAGVIGGLFKS